MKVRSILPAVAAFWCMIRCAVLYYIMIALLPAGQNPADRFLYIWAVSPSMICAAAFFFVFFRPREYPGALSIGKLSLGFDAVVALISVIGMTISDGNGIGDA